MKIAKRIFMFLTCFFILTFATFALTSCDKPKPTVQESPGFELSVKIEHLGK